MKDGGWRVEGGEQPKEPHLGGVRTLENTRSWTQGIARERIQPGAYRRLSPAQPLYNFLQLIFVFDALQWELEELQLDTFLESSHKSFHVWSCLSQRSHTQNDNFAIVLIIKCVLETW